MELLSAFCAFIALIFYEPEIALSIINGPDGFIIGCQVGIHVKKAWGISFDLDLTIKIIKGFFEILNRVIDLFSAHRLKNHHHADS